MGFMNKLKNLFTDEVEEEIEEPVKKEVYQVKIAAPVQPKEEIEEIQVEPAIKEVASQKPKAIYFDDKDFDVVDYKPAAHKVRPVVKPYEPVTETYQVKKKQPETKTFSPSPIISPIYGVLNKNYQSFDIKEKNTGVKPQDIYENKSAPTLDEVRKVAYDKDFLKEFEPVEEELSEKDFFPGFDQEDLTIGEVQTNHEKKKETLDDDLFGLIDNMYDDK